MEGFKIKIGESLGRDKEGSPLLKESGPVMILGYSLLLICCVLLGWLIITEGLTATAIILLSMVAIPIIYLIVMYPKAGIIILMVAAYFVMWFTHMNINFPLGTVIDTIELLLIIGFFIKQKKNPNWGIFRSSISYIILIWVIYNMLQILNPVAESRLVWVYTIRSVAAIMLMYFVFVYHIRSVEFIRLVLKIWIALAVIGTAYAFWQEYVGFLPFEEEFLQSDPKYRGLLYIAGKWRKFSIYSDPVAFSYNMVISSILCIVLMFNKIKLWKKVLLGVFAFFMLWAMFFSGTRGAYVLLPAALALLALLKMTNIRIILFAAAAGVFLAFLIYVPTSSYNLRRFQSAFKPSQDASFNVRVINQQKIQPYIQDHPFGAGLGAVSAAGKNVIRHSVLHDFAPDSGYVRVAVELGWVGLFLFCTLLFLIVRSGINSYFKIRDPELQNYCLAMTLIAFVLAVGSYPQEAIVQFPTSVYFYLVVAIITITRQLDEKNYPKPKKPVKYLF